MIKHNWRCAGLMVAEAMLERFNPHYEMKVKALENITPEESLRRALVNTYVGVAKHFGYLWVDEKR